MAKVIRVQERLGGCRASAAGPSHASCMQWSHAHAMPCRQQCHAASGLGLQQAAILQKAAVSPMWRASLQHHNMPLFHAFCAHPPTSPLFPSPLFTSLPGEPAPSSAASHLFHPGRPWPCFSTTPQHSMIAISTHLVHPSRPHASSSTHDLPIFFINLFSQDMPTHTYKTCPPTHIMCCTLPALL